VGYVEMVLRNLRHRDVELLISSYVHWSQVCQNFYCILFKGFLLILISFLVCSSFTSKNIPKSRNLRAHRLHPALSSIKIFSVPRLSSGLWQD
jgi:hypothetical protein